MTEDRGQKMTRRKYPCGTDNNKRCQAVTCKGRRCRNEAVYFRIYEGNRLEYLSCKIHFQDFRPHPGQKGQQPPKEEM
jgi:hypothetical protein